MSRPKPALPSMRCPRCMGSTIAETAGRDDAGAEIKERCRERAGSRCRADAQRALLARPGSGAERGVLAAPACNLPLYTSTAAPSRRRHRLDRESTVPAEDNAAGGAPQQRSAPAPRSTARAGARSSPSRPASEGPPPPPSAMRPSRRRGPARCTGHLAAARARRSSGARGRALGPVLGIDPAVPAEDPVARSAHSHDDQRAAARSRKHGARLAVCNEHARPMPCLRGEEAVAGELRDRHEVRGDVGDPLRLRGVGQDAPPHGVVEGAGVEGREEVRTAHDR